MFTSHGHRDTNMRIWQALLLVFFSSSGGSADFTTAFSARQSGSIVFQKLAEFVQTANNNSITTANFSSNVSSGNLMVCWMFYNSATLSISSVADTGGNTYVKAVGPTTGANTAASFRQEIWYAANVTGGAAFSVTATFSGTANVEKSISCHEYSGAITVNPLDQTSAAVGSGGLPSSGAVSTTNNEMVFGALFVMGTSSPVGPGFNPHSTLLGNSTEDRSAYGESSSANWLAGPTDWIAQAATFKAMPTVSYDITMRQQSSVDAGNTTSSNLAFLGNNGYGNLIIVPIRVGSTSASITVTDSKSNAYNLASCQNQTTDASRVCIYYAMNIASGPNTVTVTLGSSQTLRFGIFEYSGLAKSNALDQTKGAQADAGTAINSGNTAATTVAKELVFAAAISSSSIAFTAGTNYLERLSVPGNPAAKLYIEDRIVTSTGAYNATMTAGSSTNWAIVVATFKR